uniref:Uncharacterized protein n=1 Tax=Picea sitchensis TaxID=3332 RepID=D5ABM9_PICSI|nr:unknown [Picea sitchensis]
MVMVSVILSSACLLKALKARRNSHALALCLSSACKHGFCTDCFTVIWRWIP